MVLLAVAMAASAVSPVKRLVSNSSTHAESNPLSRDAEMGRPYVGCDPNNNSSGIEHKSSSSNKNSLCDPKNSSCNNASASCNEHRKSSGASIEDGKSSCNSFHDGKSSSGSLQEQVKNSTSSGAPQDHVKSEGKSSSGGRRKISLPSWFRQTSSAGAKSKLTRQHTIDSPGNFHARFIRKQASTQAAQRLQVRFLAELFI